MATCLRKHARSGRWLSGSAERQTRSSPRWHTSVRPFSTVPPCSFLEKNSYKAMQRDHDACFVGRRTALARKKCGDCCELFFEALDS
jgi:hypothetical protein